MATNKLTQRDEIIERNAAQALMLITQSDQRRGSPTNENILSTSSSDETEKLRSSFLITLKAEEKFQIYLQNTNFKKAQFMRLHEIISKSLQVSLNTGRAKKYKLSVLDLFFDLGLLEVSRNAGRCCVHLLDKKTILKQMCRQ